MCFFSPCKLHAAFTSLSRLRSAQVYHYGSYRTWKQKKEEGVTMRQSCCDIWHLKLQRRRLYRPVQVGGLGVVDVLALLSYGGRVVPVALTLSGLQWVEMALQFNLARGQGHVMRPLYFPVHLHRHVLVQLVWIQTFAALCWGGHIDHVDVWDAGLPQGELWVGQLQLFHVVDGYGSVKGLLWGEQKQEEGQKVSPDNRLML